MKDLKPYVNNLYISLEDISENLRSKITNLDGYKINECCGCSCDCDCGCEPESCDKCCDPTMNPGVGVPTNITPNLFGRFNSESEIIRELDSHPTVNTLLDIHNQFAKFLYVKDIEKGYIEPLYFGSKDYSLSTNTGVIRQNGDMPIIAANPESIEQLYDVATYQNKKIYKVVNDVVNAFDFKCPVIETKMNGEVQVYVVKHGGTNGKEGSIKSSLEEVAEILGKLDSKSEIQWSQVLDVSIDNIDDLYSFVITFVLNPDKVREQIQGRQIKKS